MKRNISSNSKSFKDIVKGCVKAVKENWLAFAFSLVCAFMAWVLLSL